MLHNMNDLKEYHELKEYALCATDGTIGHVKDFYFGDETWVIRYLVVDAGGWLVNRKVLISPIAIDQIDPAERILSVRLTKDQVKNSPDIDTEKPVSRQYEMKYFGHYGYPHYWDGGGIWGNGAYPSLMLAGDFALPSPPPPSNLEIAYSQAEEDRHNNDDPHLRSCQAILDYHLHASDGDIGHVQGMLIDDTTWAVRYLIVNTSNWWLGHKVLIAPRWIKEVRWSDATVYVNLSRQAIKDAPPYDSTIKLGREQEIDIHEHYGLPGYWTNETEYPEHGMTLVHE